MKRYWTIFVKALLFSILVPGSVVVGVPYLLIGGILRPGRLVAEILGAVLLIAGVMIYLRCAWDFIFVGQGTPAPIDPPRILVATDLYCVVRNPMYFGILAIVLGEAIIFRFLRLCAYAVLLWLGFHLFVVFYEEPRLAKKFGPSYQRYRSTVPRWVPKLTHAVSTQRNL